MSIICRLTYLQKSFAYLQVSRFMRYFLFVMLLLVIWASGNAAQAESAVGDLAKQEAIELRVSLGNKANELKFVPDRLSFVSGKRYKLILSNPSNQKHYFTAKDFSDNIWSQKVESGKAEVKGAIHDLELKPGGVAEWVFVPVKSGTYDLKCSIPGHSEAGMVGTLQVSTIPQA